MLAKYVLCILTIEWAVLGMRLLKGKGRSYERIRNDDRIREKEQFVRFQGMNRIPDSAHDICRFRPPDDPLF